MTSEGADRPTRQTRQRAAVTAILADSREFRSAQDLHAALADAGTRVGLATVYRTLQALSADGEVDMLRTADGEALYRACEVDHHHHHLVCRSCGRTVEVAGAGVEAWASAMAAEHGFSDLTHTVELVGICAQCAALRSPG